MQKEKKEIIEMCDDHVILTTTTIYETKERLQMKPNRFKDSDSSVTDQ